jgi:SulP family sulfate permease
MAGPVMSRVSPVSAVFPGYGAGAIRQEVQAGLTVAVALSLIDVVRRSATPRDAVLGWVERLGRYPDVSLHPRAVTTPGVLVYRLDDQLFFGNAGYVRGRIEKALVGSLQDRQVGLVVARLKGPMRRAFRDVGLLDLIEERHLHPTVRDAVAAARSAWEGV